jgi:Holliday junction resolvase RusA-like endonuclease
MVMGAVAALARCHGLRPMTEPVEVTFRWTVPDRRRRDIDNLAANGIAKAVLDALVEGGWLVDDSTQHVTQVRTEVVYEKWQRRLEVILEEVE